MMEPDLMGRCLAERGQVAHSLPGRSQVARSPAWRSLMEPT